MYSTKSCAGISFKSQALYTIVYVTRYVDLFWAGSFSMYNTIMKLFFISSSIFVLYLMQAKFRPTHDPNIDTLKIEYLLGGSAVLALIVNYKFTPAEVRSNGNTLLSIKILWSFSIWLESVAILPQLFMLQRTGEAETITTHYIFALGAYRGLYIPNWIYRYFSDEFFDPIAVVAGLLQTVLYSDFFYIYYTKFVSACVAD